MLRTIAALVMASVLSGCLAGAAISAAGTVVETSVNVTGAVVETGVKTTGAVVDAVIPGDDDDRGRDRNRGDRPH